MARNIYGLDLGTYEIKIFDKKKVRIWREKNVIAMKDKKYIFPSEMKRIRCMKKHRRMLRSFFR